jgi:murein DD-endopeptidase MepM/ murein hydrolase activator NlpD
MLTGAAGSLAAALSWGDARAADAAWCYPLAFPERAPGDGLFIKHAFGCENLVYYPGLTHTGENWYGLEANAANANVIAIAPGKVVYADFDYPGRVVLVAHADRLYSMYGHLDDALQVQQGQDVERGQVLGRVLARSDDYARSHLHFEIRTFLTRDEVNGDAPRYGFTCGYRCPPGPGYWPMGAEHPAEIGWLHPAHVINRRLGALERVAVPSVVRTETTPLWSAPPWRDGALQVGELALDPGSVYPLTGVATGADGSRNRTARGYRLWYRLALEPSSEAWAQAALPSADAVDSAGAPAAIDLALIPAP